MNAVKARKAALVASLFAASAVAITPAWADRGHGHYNRGHAGRHGPNAWGLGLGLLAGTALVLSATTPRPAYYPQVVYSAPPVYVPPPVIVQRVPVQVMPPPQPAYAEPAWWYYCNAPAGYYPYVGSCPSGWIRVSPQPAG